MRHLSSICLVAGALLFASVASAAVPFQFDSKVYEIGGTRNSVQMVATADLDGNSAVDIMFAKSFDTAFYVFFNDGSGGMDLPVRYEMPGEFVTSVFGIEANGDGHPDIVVRSYSVKPHPLFDTTHIWTFLNNGDGTFSPSTVCGINVTQTWSDRTLTAGDVDNDGDIDLLLSCVLESKVAVILNDGNGKFALAGRYTAVGYTQEPLLVDLNGDHNLDITVLSEGDNGFWVSTLLGAGDGTFGSATSLPVRYRPIYPSASDLNSDGVPDLVFGHGGFPAFLTVLQGNGDGTFVPQVMYERLNPYHGNPCGVATVDLDRDGWSDIAVNTTAGMQMVFLINQRNGSYSLRTGPDYGYLGEGMMVAADLDNNGWPDLVNEVFDGVGIMLSRACSGDLDGSGNQDIADLTLMIDFLYLNGATPSLAAADVDGDDTIDISDLTRLIGYLYLEGDAPVCR